MTLYYKIAGLVAVAMALAGAFVSIPYLAMILALLGVYISFSVAGDNHVRVIVSAIALASLSRVFDGIPAVGGYLSTFIGGVGTVLAGMAVTIVLANIVRRLKS